MLASKKKVNQMNIRYEINDDKYIIYTDRIGIDCIDNIIAIFDNNGYVSDEEYILRIIEEFNNRVDISD